jgi:hypothetical protein
MDGKSVHERSRKEAEPTIPQLLGAPQDQPFHKADRRADDGTDATPAEPSKKAQNAADANDEPVVPTKRPVKHVKKTYGAKDRHALDRLIETSHSDASNP